MACANKPFCILVACRPLKVNHKSYNENIIKYKVQNRSVILGISIRCIETIFIGLGGVTSGPVCSLRVRYAHFGSEMVYEKKLRVADSDVCVCLVPHRLRNR